MQAKVKQIDLFNELPILIMCGKISIEQIPTSVRMNNRSVYVLALRRFRSEKNALKYKEVIKLMRQDAVLAKDEHARCYLNILAEQLEDLICNG